jgi:hypothetical protein
VLLAVPAVWVGRVAAAPVVLLAKMNPAVLKVAAQVLDVEQVLPIQQVLALAAAMLSADSVRVAAAPLVAAG